MKDAKQPLGGPESRLAATWNAIEAYFEVQSLLEHEPRTSNTVNRPLLPWATTSVSTKGDTVHEGPHVLSRKTRHPQSEPCYMNQGEHSLD
jgi:hypothetical protein